MYIVITKNFKSAKNTVFCKMNNIDENDAPFEDFAAFNYNTCLPN